MAEIDVPFVDSEVNTSNPTGSLMTVVMLIVGFGLFYMASSIGQYVAGQANSAVGNILGVNPATGSDSTPDVL